nr:xylulose kinase-1 [Tanacetum cinerariifolium]
MALTFAETHNMVAYLRKADASEGFNQIIDFLNGSSIKYALTVNPYIYVSCIKQFWTTVAVKKVNNVIRLQALVNKKKVVVTEATIREALHLDDEEGVECLPNKEIFTELAKMGYEKPSTKLTFYKAFFSSHLVRNVDSPSKFYMYSCFLQLMIRKQVGDLLTHTTKYTYPALTHKVFANMRIVGKGFSGVKTPLFEGMLVEQQVIKEGDAEVNDETVNAGDAAEGDDSAAHGEVPTVADEPSIPSPTPLTPPPQPSHDIPSTSQVQPTPPQSPQVQPPSPPPLPQPQPQPQPQQDARIPMNLLQDLMDTYSALTRRVEHLEFDKVTQAIKITKLKQRVNMLDWRNKVRVLKLRRLQKVGTSQRVETFDETMTDDVSNQGRMVAKMDQDADVVLEDDRDVADAVKDVKNAKVDESVDIQGRHAESQAKIYKIDLDHANKVLSMQKDETEPAKKITTITTKAQVPAATLTVAPVRVTATPSRRRKGVVIRDLQEELTTSTIIPAETKSKDNGKGILIEEPKLLNKKQQIKQDEQYAREEDLEALLSLVKERFCTTKPKNCSDDFLLVTLGAMFEKPDIHAQIWKNQRSVHGPAKLILLVERKYPLTRFTLDQMLNAVRLEVKEESEVSLELLSYGVDATIHLKKNMISV